MAVIVNTIYGFDAPILRMSLFSTPMLVLLFVLVFPTTISYLLLPLGLKYLKTTLVAIYGYLILIVATVTSFYFGAGSLLMDAVGGDCSYLCQCLSGRGGRE